MSVQQTYLLPNGCSVRIGERIRVASSVIWQIPEEDRWRFELEDQSASPGSEVLRWPADRIGQ